MQKQKKKIGINVVFMPIYKMSQEILKGPRGDYESVGRGFESLPSHQTKKIRTFFQSEKGSDFSFLLEAASGEITVSPVWAPQDAPAKP